MKIINIYSKKGEDMLQFRPHTYIVEELAKNTGEYLPDYQLIGKELTLPRGRLDLLV